MTDRAAEPRRRPGRAPRRGVSFALAAAALFGVSAPVAKQLLDVVAPQLLAGLLYAGAGVGLAGVWLVRRGAAREAPLTPRDVPWLAGGIVCGGVVAPLLLMAGLARTLASTASLLLSLEGAFTALLAWFVFREGFDRRVAWGMASILAGGVVVSWQGGMRWEGLAGPLAVAGACLGWALDNNLTQRVSGGDPVQVAMLKGIVAGGANALIALALGTRLPDAGILVSALLLGFLSYGLSLVLFVRALRHLGTARTAAYFSSAPFLGAAVSLLLFAERPTASLLLGAALMAVGAGLHLSERHEHQHAHEEIGHDHAHAHDEHHRHEHAQSDPPGEPHRHWHRHAPLRHVHPHTPDLHHRHRHG